MQIEINGQSAYAYTGGKPFDAGLPCVVFIHGAQNDHSVWGLQSRWFAHHGYSVLAVDLPGHGRSAGTPLPSIEALADWIELLLEKVGAGDTAKTVSLVGHSMGSLMALECASRHPARIARIALIGTAVPMPVSDVLLGPAKDNEPKAISMINTWSHSPRGTIGGNTVPGMWLLGAARRLMERQQPGVLHNDLAACNAYSHGMDAAAALACPALIVSGSRDMMTHPKAAAKLAAAIKDVRSINLDGAGHALMAEQPDAVLDALRGFIA
ncbi:alpha/beta fold hydrolase [Sulfuritalea hydrogenivorans]|uniref:Alpha/beta hydrolase n=1 Tax=Sulfuritalea hydrogenivorans sk43H TaxID=1223802 RepID=W0SEY8_9PROT|nr:alpha/beta hydrolase [Sulfuritalea hydrogenivorans]BAO29799.1 alpha/beta hydrolase [Sulfuritalea hydrogenivorans sk43H]